MQFRYSVFGKRQRPVDMELCGSRRWDYGELFRDFADLCFDRYHVGFRCWCGDEQPIRNKLRH